MKFKKGDIVEINHTRKGIFKAIVKKDFNSRDESYPVILYEGDPIKLGGGISGLLGIDAGRYNYDKGQEIPCMKFLVTYIKKVEMKQ